MAVSEGIFSIRLVIADFYMEKPVPGLDPVYSEFRGKEIKNVPIIRVFGSNALGQKTCMHIHGVFPYFYVPYDQKDFESVNKAIYQMAINLDKAINISLSQGSSGVQHVFKVQLVKGIPFYGYHRSDHQYLKIYMFNPRFVRRAANLLQNGAIMNKNFHPHEAHVPYVLQFTIDYNLYGMSFIHVPLEIIKFRRSDISEQIPFKNLLESQILDHNVAKKLSCSTLEIDIGSNFILNRFQLIAKTSTTHTNPGIESIWNDEKLRRQKMAQVLEDDEDKLNAIPPLELPSTQDRPNVSPTESEIFYRTALVNKLVALETTLMDSSQTSDQTINCTFQSNTSNATLNNSLNSINRNQKRTFNLTKILQNSVYPEECTQNENLVNASFVENHLSNHNAFEQSLQTDMSLAGSSDKTKIPEDNSIFLDDTIVDEELVLSLTQQQAHVPLDATLRDEDLELLDILQQLDEDNNDNKIDLDSSLAPLSQNNKNYSLSPDISKKEIMESIVQPPTSNVECGEENIDEDNIHDFSITLENLDDLILKLTQSQKNTHDSIAQPSNSLTQIDGADDLLKTPTKPSTSSTTNITSPRTPTAPKARRLSQASPSRSPRTPKNSHKYKPLPLIITNRSTGKKIINDSSADTTPSKTSGFERENDLPSVFLRKKVARNELHRKRLSIEINTHDGPKDLPNNTNVNIRRSRAYKYLDKTHITCNLTPRKTNEKLLKVYCVDEQKKKAHESTPKTPADQQRNSIHTTGCNKDQDAKNTGAFAAHEEDDEEVVESDDESTLRLKYTPNLKRLRRSFLSSRSIKRHKVEAHHDNVINSSKFENNNLILEPTNNEQILGTSDPTDKFATNSANFKKSKGLFTSKEFVDPTKSNNLKSDTIAETHSELEVNKYYSRTNKCSEKIVTGSEVSSATYSKQSLTNLNNELIKPLEINKKSIISKDIQPVKKVVRHSKRIETICKTVDAKELRSSKRSMQKPDSDTGNEIRPEEKKPKISKQNLHTINLPKEKLSFTSNTSEESLNCDSLDVVNKEIHNPQYSGNLVHACTSPSSKSSNCDTNKDLKNSEKQHNIKNVRVRLKRLENKNLEVFDKESFESSKENVKNHLPKAAYTYDEASESTKVKKRKEILDKTVANSSTDKLVIANNTENLLKSLLKLHGTVRTEMPTKFTSSDVTSVLPSLEYSSQSSPKDLFQESPVMSHTSDDEINETPPYCDNNDSNPSRCYEKSVMLHSPLLFTQNSSPNIILPNNLFQNSKTNSISDLKEPDIVSVSSSNGTNENVKQAASPPLHSSLVLTPLDLPPTREDVLKGCIKLKLAEYDFQQPYYSNPDDITKQKEIGFTILQIPGNKLNDLEEFQSILGPDTRGIAAWRRSHLLRLSGPEILHKYRNTQRIREYFADHKAVSITPHINAPTRQEVKLWLKARDLLKNKGEHLNINGDTPKRLTEEDSPIKVRRQKVTMMLNNEGGESGEDCDNSLDCSTRSLTLTPLTPATPLALDRLNKKDKKICTPVTTKFEKIPLERVNSFRKCNNRRVLKRISLNQKIKEALEKEKPSPVAEHHSQENIIIPASDESILPNSQTSRTSSVSSETALAEMERSSFMHQIQQNCATINFSNNNSTLNNTFGFKVALENLQQAKADIEFNYLTIITLEVFVPTRDDLFPNPQIDEIRCLFYAIENSVPNDHIDNDKNLPRTSCGYIMVHDSRDIVAKEGRIHGIDRDIAVTIVHTEVEALEALLGLCSRWDPDIYAGYEIEMSSWGFVIERAKYLCLNIAPLLSRVPSQKTRDFVDEDREQFTDLDVEMKLCGRILLDVWRLMRSEIALTSYTFENVMYHIMHKRCPWHSYRTLTEWFSTPCSRWIVIEYYLERVRGTLSLLDQLDLIGRTSEMAKLIGIQFYEVLSRGSQFRVESMMLRIAKPKNIVPLSPSVQQRAHMRAPEYLPLILEPQSRFYADPLIVLDFQSLYPSMIIGYNYCFSTCLGRVEHLGQSTPFEFGASQLRVSPSMLRKLVDRDLITISPCGVVFVKSSVREGILPRMLTEILDTRQMVKQSMKVHKTNSALQRILHSRQLGLKLVANTTYGYTAANFSGRMPAVEVGDTVVAKGRETLERAIKMVEANDKWNVKVVYGDTDSMFVLVPGRNREEAFRIGEEIADAVTKQNPQPVKLKLEKVYQPCILQTKKRYVGYMYETSDQKEPVYEAKGIETVRRDGCPIVAKMLEKVLRILFESADVSRVKQYVCRQFTKLLSGRANLQDLIFAKEFRGINGYKANACVPALELTRKWIQADPRRIPRRGERVPFIITNGPPGVPLIRLIRHPHEVLDDEGLKINAIYYITKAIIPPLNRCLLLLGADVNDWFANLPRKTLMTPALSIANEVIACPNIKSKKSTISQFFSTTNCITDCGRHTKQGICMECHQNPSRSMVILQMKISKIERGYLSTQQICQSCCGRLGNVKCGSLECPVLYVSEVKRRDLQQIGHFRNILKDKFLFW